MAYQTLAIERSGPVATVTIQREKQLNALNAAVLGELLAVLRELSVGCRVLILTGAGSKAFVAGADIAEMAPLSPSQARAFAELGHSVTALLEELPCATIAAVNGYALGGGLELAMACDLVYVAEGAKLGQPEVNLGIVPGFGGTQRLSRLVGKVRAKELIFTGEMIDARKAKEIGLCLDVLSAAELLPHCRRVAQTIAQRAPLAIARAKRLVERGFDLPLPSANVAEAEAFALLFDTDDRREGMKAFLEKRSPTFNGR